MPSLDHSEAKTQDATPCSPERFEIEELKARVFQLERRMLEFENEASRPRVTAMTVEPEIEAAAASVKPGDDFAVLFSRLAMLSFVLLGALILKVLTQQNILTPGIGIFIGFVYALHFFCFAVGEFKTSA